MDGLDKEIDEILKDITDKCKLNKDGKHDMRLISSIFPREVYQCFCGKIEYVEWGPPKKTRIL